MIVVAHLRFLCVTWLLDRRVFQAYLVLAWCVSRSCALYDKCYTFLSRLDSALRVRCVSAVCVTCVHFLNSCGLFVVQRQHLLVQGTACAPPLAQFTLIVFKSARTVLGSVSAALLLLFAQLASCACSFWPAHQGSQGQPKPRPSGAFKIFVLFMRVCAWVAVACVSVMNNDMYCVTAWEWA